MNSRIVHSRCTGRRPVADERTPHNASTRFARTVGSVEEIAQIPGPWSVKEIVQTPGPSAAVEIAQNLRGSFHLLNRRSVQEKRARLNGDQGRTKFVQRTFVDRQSVEVKN